MADSPTEYCYGENAYFPADEFEDDPLLGRIHRTKSPHTVMGDAIERAELAAMDDALVDLNSGGTTTVGPGQGTGG